MPAVAKRAYLTADRSVPEEKGRGAARAWFTSKRRRGGVAGDGSGDAELRQAAGESPEEDDHYAFTVARHRGVGCR